MVKNIKSDHQDTQGYLLGSGIISMSELNTQIYIYIYLYLSIHLSIYLYSSHPIIDNALSKAA